MKQENSSDIVQSFNVELPKTHPPSQKSQKKKYIIIGSIVFLSLAIITTVVLLIVYCSKDDAEEEQQRVPFDAPDLLEGIEHHVLIVAAVAFNIEKMKMALIFFAAALVFAVIMVGLNRLAVGLEKSRNK